MLFQECLFCSQAKLDGCLFHFYPMKLLILLDEEVNFVNRKDDPDILIVVQLEQASLVIQFVADMINPDIFALC